MIRDRRSGLTPRFTPHPGKKRGISVISLWSMLTSKVGFHLWPCLLIFLRKYSQSKFCRRKKFLHCSPTLRKKLREKIYIQLKRWLCRTLTLYRIPVNGSQYLPQSWLPKDSFSKIPKRNKGHSSNRTIRCLNIWNSVTYLKLVKAFAINIKNLSQEILVILIKFKMTRLL